MVQDKLSAYGVEIRERGAGFIFAHRGKSLFVKASAVDRSFSRKSLESAFGAFEASRSEVSAKLSYGPNPLVHSKESDGLYQVYCREREEQQAKRDVTTQIRKERTEALKEIKERYAARRQEVKLDKVIRKGRKHLVYQALSKQMKGEIDALFKSSAAKGKGDTTKVLGWRDWLHQQAQKGNEAALGLLRQRGKPAIESGIGSLSGVSRGDSLFSGLSRKVSREGVVEYRTAEGGILVDYGSQIVVKSADQELLKVALLIGQAKFGDSMQIRGDEIATAASLTLKQPEEQELTRNSPIRGKGLGGPER